MATEAPEVAGPHVSFTLEHADPLTEVVGDPSHAAVWFWNAGDRGDVIYRLDAGGDVRSWAVLTGKRAIDPGIQSGLAVAGGFVWLGLGQTLVRLDPFSGAVRTWAVPVGRVNPRESRIFPHGIPPRITSVAVSATGQVAVALYPMSSIDVLDPGANRFAVLDMPSVEDLDTALAYTQGGTLGIAYSDLAERGRTNINHVLLVDGAHRRVVTVRDATTLTPWRSGLIAGDAEPDVVPVAGPVRRLPAPTTLVGTAEGTPLAVLGADRLAGRTDSGVVVFPGDARSDAEVSSRSRLYLTPEEQCLLAGPSIPPGPIGVATTIPASTTTGICRQPVSAIATDADDDLWILTGANADTVLLLAQAH